ncbi:uncharacterized protein LOC132202624 [Neocloeon triangulifer]|uniref:uncharacterized protein LOC132202624 n=1 Tax=Neocloeon triangulifer TaxID=2078957 RepID=UPI00286EEAB2|nr:uncharacterized protein LOC132202624 [Neocloeon triangulifer]
MNFDQEPAPDPKWIPGVQKPIDHKDLIEMSNLDGQSTYARDFPKNPTATPAELLPDNLHPLPSEITSETWYSSEILSNCNLDGQSMFAKYPAATPAKLLPNKTNLHFLPGKIDSAALYSSEFQEHEGDGNCLITDRDCPNEEHLLQFLKPPFAKGRNEDYKNQLVFFEAAQLGLKYVGKAEPEEPLEELDPDWLEGYFQSIEKKEVEPQKNNADNSDLVFENEEDMEFVMDNILDVNLAPTECAMSDFDPETLLPFDEADYQILENLILQELQETAFDSDKIVGEAEQEQEHPWIIHQSECERLQMTNEKRDLNKMVQDYKTPAELFPDNLHPLPSEIECGTWYSSEILSNCNLDGQSMFAKYPAATPAKLLPNKTNLHFLPGEIESAALYSSEFQDCPDEEHLLKFVKPPLAKGRIEDPKNHLDFFEAAQLGLKNVENAEAAEPLEELDPDWLEGYFQSLEKKEVEPQKNNADNSDLLVFENEEDMEFLMDDILDVNLAPTDSNIECAGSEFDPETLLPFDEADYQILENLILLELQETAFGSDESVGEAEQEQEHPWIKFHQGECERLRMSNEKRDLNKIVQDYKKFRDEQGC